MYTQSQWNTTMCCAVICLVFGGTKNKQTTFSTLSVYSTVYVQVWDWDSIDIVPVKGVFYLTLQLKFS